MFTFEGAPQPGKWTWGVEALSCKAWAGPWVWDSGLWGLVAAGSLSAAVGPLWELPPIEESCLGWRVCSDSLPGATLRPISSFLPHPSFLFPRCASQGQFPVNFPCETPHLMPALWNRPTTLLCTFLHCSLELWLRTLFSNYLVEGQMVPV